MVDGKAVLLKQRPEALRAGEVEPGAVGHVQLRAGLGERALDGGDVALRAELAHQQPAALQCAMDAPQQRAVVADPVEHRVGEDHVPLLRVGQVERVAADELKLRVQRAGALDHLRGAVRAQHAAAHARKPRRQRTRAAAQVQDGLLRVLRDELKQLRTVFGHEVVLLIVQRRVPFHMRFPHCFGIYLYYSTVREKCNRSEPRGRIFQRWRGLFGPALYFAGICAIIVPAMRKREIYAVLQLFRGRGHVRRHAH